VEVEVFTNCNRTCWFCPNSYIDRRGANTYMDEGLYLRILEDLASIDYSGVITYSRYNEPLADRIILTRIRQARQHLPKATLSTHTNGDYLDQDYLRDLKEAGLDRLKVQVYLGNDEHFEDEAMRKRLARRINDLGLPHRTKIAEPNVRYLVEAQYPGMEVKFDARNFDVIGVDRGQTIVMPTAYERTAPCFIVFRYLYIDHDGSVVPCFMTGADSDAQPPERLAAIDEQSLTGDETRLGRSQKGNRIGNHVGAGRLATGFELLPGGKHFGRSRACHRRIGKARRHRIDRNLSRPQLHGHGPGQSNDGRLGGDIVGKAGAPECAARRNRDDVAARLHAPRRLLCGNEGADHIDLEHLPKGRLPQLQQRRIVVNAGRADHGVDAWLLVQRGHHRRAITDIAHRRHDIQTARAQHIDRGLQTVGLPVHGHDPKTVARQAGCSGQAYALRGTGDKREPVGPATCI